MPLRQRAQVQALLPEQAGGGAVSSFPGSLTGIGNLRRQVGESRMLRAGLLFIGILALNWGGSLSARALDAGPHPDAAELRRQAERCRVMLRRSVFDFYVPGALDPVNGGFLENWRDGRFVARGEKFLTLQARQLWFFSTCATAGIERGRSLEAAVSVFIFLDRYFRDHQRGGYYSTTDEVGNPKDTRKHAYHQAFQLYGLVAYYEATKDRSVLRRAQELFDVMERRMADARHGGYHEFFHADWRPVTDRRESGYVGAIGTKTYNTHLHLMEAVAALHRVAPDARVRARLEELVRINTVTVRHPVHPCHLDGWQPDWQPVRDPGNLRASYGHDVECVWLTLDAGRSLGWPASLLRGWAQGLADASLRHGWDDEHGGFFYAGPPGEMADDTRKEWWVQAEALVGMLELYQLTGDARYYTAFVRTLDFIEKHHLAPGGGWWATREADGSASANDSRSSMWQGAYHNGRALLFSARILSNLQPRTN